MSARRRATVALLAAALSASATEASIQRAEAMRYALLVEPESSDGVAQLDDALTQHYGYQVLRVPFAEADRESIQRVMSELSDLIRPYDELLVFIGLPLVEEGTSFKGEGVSYLPHSGTVDSPWTLLPVRELVAWLTRLLLGAGLLVHLSCAVVLGTAFGAELAGFAYGKRPGAIDVLIACDLPAALPMRGALVLAPVAWRADSFARVIAC